MRLSASSRAVSIRIGTCEVRAQRFGEIETGFAGHHHIEDEKIEVKAVELGAGIGGVFGGGDAIAFAAQVARQQVADAPVVVDDAGDAAHRRQACACVGIASASRPHARLRCGARRARALDEPQHAVALARIEHRDQEAAGRVVRSRPEFGEARARCAAVCRPASSSASASPFAVTYSSRWRRSCAPFLLLDITLVDQLLEHPAERLLGDLQNARAGRPLSCPDCG